MDTRQLRTLLAIVETGSFARAADKVALTPSAVSQQIQALESEVRASLFNRDNRPPTLTTAGHQMVEAARELVRATENALDAISGKRVVGTFAIGSVRSSAIALLPKAISRMVALHPGLKVKLRVGNSADLVQDVAAGRLDAAIIADNSVSLRELNWQPFIREPLYIIAPPGTPMTDAATLLESHPFVRFRSNVPLALMIEAELGRMNLTLNDIAEMDTVAAVTACVANGLGVSIVPHFAAIEGKVDLLRLPFGEPPVFRQIGLLKRPEGPRAQLIDELHEQLADVSGVYGVHAH
ncbi:LysR family transcriptional regulator [Paracoccus xiamenensis]|uniref:LysR family transcriptional regulator n=1 Tax=Paracoccus xiamenensis TaxID=2714901 RepID=UPI0014091F94|nr:LysR family transcriptional regulator [Paracoccus xiamenensis]NHF74545.1 LysR family transcriptional regulator [Paracoccus xiamenensis]